jgi:soluble lytic murein transglycosylase
MLVALLRRACVGFGPVWIGGLMLVCAVSAAAAPPKPSLPTSADDVFLAARDAARTGDRERLATLAPRLPADYPLASYLAFWQLLARLKVDEATNVDAAVASFLERYPGTYLADRARLEWALALGARADWARFEKERKELIWGDDNQIRCYAQLSRYHGTPEAQRSEVAREARRLLASTRDSAAEGCAALADTLLTAGHLAPWERIRALVEQNQYATARRVVFQLPKAEAAQAAQVIERPAVWLTTHERRLTEVQRELAIVAIVRLARDDAAQAAKFAQALNLHFSNEQRGIVWGRIGHMAALKLDPNAVEYYRRGGERVGIEHDAARATEVLEWQVRAALRAGDWAMVRTAIERMPPEQRTEPAWMYWHARALKADASEGAMALAEAQLKRIAGGFDFYGALAAEELGQPIAAPPAVPAPSTEAVAAYASNAGLARALKFYELGMRVEGHREWNWQLRGLPDAQLLAAAEFARSKGVLDRMISTSDRTREVVDITQRYPAPHREQLAPIAKSAGLDENWVYGLIRQESRFIADIRSSAGAMGLMQVMPATARYVAKRIGMSDYAPARITEVDVNLKLGVNYLRLVYDDLDTHPVLATAAYNAGPSRPRAWRSTLTRPVEGAIFAETIPFNETRDYVKRVMTNAAVYAAQFDAAPQSLKARLGTVAPKAAGSTELP